VVEVSQGARLDRIGAALLGLPPTAELMFPAGAAAELVFKVDNPDYQATIGPFGGGFVSGSMSNVR
jgi:hypothetical protein